MLRRLGEELNPHPDQGILELVRNAYDADATKCTVELIATHEAGGTVRVADDGTGMTVKSIRDGWLVLGTSAKTETERTKGRRFPIGNKGIGRLAALRLGRTALLATRPVEEPALEHRLTIDWNQFDKAKIVDQVPLVIETVPRAAKVANGTVVEIKRLREKLSKADVKRLARALVLLADPFRDEAAGVGVTGFSPVLKAPEFEDLEKLVARGYREEADYYLRAELTDKGRASAIVTDYNGEEIIRGGHGDICEAKGSPPYVAPAAIFELWWFLLGGGAGFSPRAVTLREVREWLGEFGGVHLYHRGMRVSPYSDFDWLDLNLRRVRSPEHRPSTNTSLGRLAVMDERGLLKPKTDRVGFIEEPAFLSLRQFASDVLEWFADQMLKRREKQRSNQKERAAKKVSRAQKNLAAAMKKLPEEAKENIEEAVEGYQQAKNEETGAVRKDLQLYRTLGTVGTTSAAFAHQAKGPLAQIESSARTLEVTLGRAPDRHQLQTLAELAAGIQRNAESLLAFAKVTLGLLQHEKRRRGNVSVHTSVKDVVALLKPYIDLREVTVEQVLLAEQDIVLASRAALECILTNLIINSLKAFESADPGERNILLRTTNVQERTGKGRVLLQLSVLDNGPGIQGISIEDIWLPGKTTTTEGTGLGLTIVRDVVLEMDGRVAALPHGELGGAELLVQLPVRKRK
jgi:signal transduction histidine kinase